MNEMTRLKNTVKDCTDAVQGKLAKLNEGIKDVDSKRQERTGKPYRKD